MSLIIKAGKEIDQLPAGTYQAVCSAVWDIGKQKSESPQYGTRIKHQIIARFEINKTIRDGEYAGKRYTLNKFYTASLGKKATLRKDLESWRGRPFTNEELMGFDIEKLIGANCVLGVVHGDNGKAQISTVSPLMDGMVKIQPELNAEMPEWVKKIKDKQILEETEEAYIPAETDNSDVVDGVPF